MRNYPDNIEDKLGVPRVREWIGKFLLSDLGQRALDEVSFLTDPGTISARQQETAEFLGLIEAQKDFPADHYADMIPVLDRIRPDGSALQIEELLPLKQSLETMKAVSRFFGEENRRLFPTLAGLTQGIHVFPFLLENLDRVITTKGTIRDSASKALKSVRQQMKQQRKAVSGVLDGILKQARKDGWVERDAELTMRSGRMVIPVPATHKRRIPGLILDESATGKTVYVEPAGIVELNNAIRELEFAEKREIEKILTELADAFRPYLAELTESYLTLGTFDLIQAKARWALSVRACVPEIRQRPIIRWWKAIHPLLEKKLRSDGRKMVPLDIALEEDKRVLLISGPNAGGKSVCLQTVGLLQYLFQCGLPVPVQQNSEFGVFDRIFLDFGDEQSLDNDLSTYSSRLLNMKYFLKHAGPATLVLMDEFGTGTEPMLGAALAEVVLQRLNLTGTFGVITTHYTNLKHVAASEEGVANGAMLFDQQKLQPLFRLEIGKPGSSFAFEIARKMGLSEDILQEAAGRVGEEHVLFDKHLRDILRDKRYWENKRRRIRQKEKKLEETLEKYEAQLKELTQERDRILRQARSEASELLSGVNRQIENTIRIIRESQAEKEATRRARKDLEQLKAEIPDEKSHKKDLLERKLRQTGARRKTMTGRSAQKQAADGEKPQKIEAGTKVRLKGQEIPGEVLQVRSGSALVAFGDMTSSVPLDRLETVSENAYRKFRRSSHHEPEWSETLRQKKMQFKPEIDVRGMRANEALQTVMDFVDEAIMIGAGTVRILHGKGDGILRGLIRDYLQTVDLVRSSRDEHVERGGAGVTVVELET